MTGLRLLPVVLALSVLAPAPPAGGDPPPVFSLAAVDGKPRTGQLDRLTAEGALRLVEGQRVSTAAAGQWLDLRRQGVRLPAHPVGEQVVLAGGDRIPLAADSTLLLARERLFFRPEMSLRPRAVELSPPLAQVALLWLAAPDRIDKPNLLLRRLLEERRRYDVVLLRNGDRLEGTVMALHRENVCRVRAGKRDVDVPFANVAVVAFSTDLLARPAPRSPHYHLMLDSGCRLHLAEAAVEIGQSRLVGKTLFGEAVEVALSQIASLSVRNGPAVYLSDLEPKRYEHTPYLGVTWPYARDGTTTGRALLLGGDTFDKGLELHGSSRLTYDLGGRYRWFESWIGLDEQAGRRGRARVKVIVDGETRRTGLPEELAAKDGPKRVRVDVRGARELTFVVDFGRLGDVQSHVIWAEARLIK